MSSCACGSQSAWLKLFPRANLVVAFRSCQLSDSTKKVRIRQKKFRFEFGFDKKRSKGSTKKVRIRVRVREKGSRFGFDKKSSIMPIPSCSMLGQLGIPLRKFWVLYFVTESVEFCKNELKGSKESFWIYWVGLLQWELAVYVHFSGVIFQLPAATADRIVLCWGSWGFPS